MNGGHESQDNNNSNRFHAGDGEDNSEVEDDTPESFRALNRSEPPWATFPDLLRVPPGTNNDIEDDSPESLSFATAQPFRSIESNNCPNFPFFRPTNSNPQNLPSSSTSSTSSCSSSSNIVPYATGTPRNRRPVPHPDVSQINPNVSVFQNSNVSSSRHGPSSSMAFPDSQGSSVSASSNPRPLPPLPVEPTSQNPLTNRPGSEIINVSRTAHHPHRNPISSLNLLSSALSSSSISSSTPPSAASLPLSLAPITNALAQVQASVDTLSRQVNERLDGMENRLNILTASSLPTNPSSSPESADSCIPNNSNLPGHSNGPGDVSIDALRDLIREQKREMHNERRTFLLSLSDALRFAAESTSGLREPTNSTPDQNGFDH